MRAYRNIVIDATCNLRCSYCSRRVTKINIDETIKNLERIFDRFTQEDSCFRVECGGEITLYPDIIEYLEEKARQRYVIEILSNGILALEVMKRNTPLRCVFSLDGHNVEMNKKRNLNAYQINNIIEAIFQFNAEISCVFSDQTVNQINDFISFLKERDYNGFLNIFPVRYNREPLRNYLDYDKLIKADFIPSAEYFRRWKYIFENGRRNFTCDMFNNGYVYNIQPGKITMKKCDCVYIGSEYEHDFGDEKIYKSSNCGTCITDLECNNTRNIVNSKSNYKVKLHRYIREHIPELPFI